MNSNTETNSSGGNLLSIPTKDEITSSHLIENGLSLNRFNNFIKNHYVNDCFNSHVSMYSPFGKFRFSRENLDKLFDLITDGHHLAEKPSNYIAIYFDCDIKVVKGEETIYLNDCVPHLYSKQQIRDCIISIQSVFLDFGIVSEKLVCCLMEKPIYETDKHTKNGFHLAFPNLILNRDEFVKFIFPKILKEVKENVNLELDPMNKYLTPWLMYGGTKNDTSKPYKLTKIFDVDFKEMTLSTLTNFKIFDTEENQIEIDNEKIESFLPRIFSINPGHREITEINKNKCKEPLIEIEEKNNFKNHTNETILTENEIQENIRKIRILLPMINCDNGKKDNSFCKWSNVVRNCSYFSNMDDDIFNEVDEWCQGYDSYKGKDSRKENQKKFYNDSDNTICNFGILVNFAKQDSPVEYEKQKDELYKKKDSLLNDDYENYIWTDFINDSNQFFSSNDELKKFFTTNFPRVCAKINYGKGIYV